MSAAEEFQVKIVTPGKNPMEYVVSRARTYATDGFTEMYPDHGAMAYALGDGLCTLMTTERKEVMIALYGGIGHFHQNQLDLFTPNLETPDDIDVERAQQALNRTRNRLKGLDPEVRGKLDITRAHAALDRAKLRLKLKGINVDE